MELKYLILSYNQSSKCQFFGSKKSLKIPKAGANPGFQVMGGALKKIAQSGGRRENIWGISCEKSRFYAKKIMFSNFREGAPPPLLLDPPLRSICLSLSISNSFPVYVHAVFHFVSSLEIHNLYFGKHNKGDKSYKYMLQFYDTGRHVKNNACAVEIKIKWIK